jgi:hypothetical protein
MWSEPNEDPSKARAGIECYKSTETGDTWQLEALDNMDNIHINTSYRFALHVNSLYMSALNNEFQHQQSSAGMGQERTGALAELFPRLETSI